MSRDMDPTRIAEKLSLISMLVHRRTFRSAVRVFQEAVVAAPKRDPYAELPKTSFCFNEPSEPNMSHNDLKYNLSGRYDLGLRDGNFTLKDYFLGDAHHLHKIFSEQHHNYKQGQKVEQRTFVDLRIVRLASGSGGNGCISFLRDANSPTGPPDGGDGGNGGSIYIQAVSNVSLLHKVRRSYVAGNGRAGTPKQLDGKSGEDVIVEVPVGTTVRWIPDPALVRQHLQEVEGDIAQVGVGVKVTPYHEVQLFRNDYIPGGGWMFKERDEEYHRERDYFSALDEQVRDYDRETIDGELMYDRFPMEGIDLTSVSEKPLLLMRGGRGGMGNMHFLTGDVRNPRFCKTGRRGLREHFMFELRLLADVGLVGLPNAGKLTLLRAISRATPRVGHWEFTTLQPTVGTISLGIDREPFTVADIPGIVAGASLNRGMGMDFLRHIERSGGLVFVVSLESADPLLDLHTLINELGSRVEGKRVLVVATKADLTKNGDKYQKLADFAASSEWRCLPVCAPRGENVTQCVQMMAEVAGGKD